MSQPRFLADHDLNEHIIAGVLRQEPAIEINRVRDVGMQESSDDEILQYADENELLVISHDVNTMSDAAYRRVSAGQSFPGLFMVHQVLPIGPVIDHLRLIWSTSHLEEWKDQVVFLPL